MGVLKNLAIFLICAVGLAGLVSFALPTTWEVSRELQIGLDSRTVHETVGDLSTWNTWSPFGIAADSSVTFTTGASTTREGATAEWSGEDVGKGSLKITASDQDKGVWFDLTLGGGRERAKGVIQYEDLPSGAIMARFSIRGDVSSDPVGRYVGIFRGYTMGPDLVESLSRLKKITEANM